jgi:hypothetical protein
MPPTFERVIVFLRRAPINALRQKPRTKVWHPPQVTSYAQA